MGGGCTCACSVVWAAAHLLMRPCLDPDTLQAVSAELFGLLTDIIHMFSVHSVIT